MFPSPDLPFLSVDQFVRSLTRNQRQFYRALEEDREQRLQCALTAASLSISGLSALLSDSIQIRLSGS